MRRVSVLLLTVALALTPCFALVTHAASNGTDAQSQSMSAGADGQEIVNETADEEAGEADDVHPIDGDLSEAADVIGVEDATEEDIAAEAKAQAEAERAPIIRMAIAIAVAVAALLAAIMLFRSRRRDSRKESRKYKSKH